MYDIRVCIRNVGNAHVYIFGRQDYVLYAMDKNDVWVLKSACVAYGGICGLSSWIWYFIRRDRQSYARDADAEWTVSYLRQIER